MSEVSVPLAPQTQEQVPESTAELPVLDDGVSVPLSAGARLRLLRETAGLSQAEVAQTLKLGVRQVEAIESENWAALPGAAIARGFVRNYARLLGANADELVAVLHFERDAVQPRLDSPVMARADVLPDAGLTRGRDLVPVIGGVLALVFAGLMFFFVPPDFWQLIPGLATLLGNEAPPSLQEAETRAIEPPSAQILTVPAAPAEPAPLSPGQLEAAQAPTDAPLPAGGGAAVTTPAAPLSVEKGTDKTVEKPAVSAETTAQARPAPSSAGMHFVFAKASWVEVRDGADKIIHSRLNPAGSEQRIEGSGPFRLVVGNASGVTLTWRGKPVDLSERSRDDVARLTLE